MYHLICCRGNTTHFTDKNSEQNVFQRVWIPKKPPVLPAFHSVVGVLAWWCWSPSGNAQSVLSQSCCHHLSQYFTFYGHNQLWCSLSPFGASLETSASILFTTSETCLFPTVGGWCIVNMLRFRHISSQISRKEGMHVWFLCPWICVHSLLVSEGPLWLQCKSTFLKV